MLGVKVKLKGEVNRKVKVKVSICVQRRLMGKLRYISNFDPGTKRNVRCQFKEIAGPV